jgi:hypothetical protein
LYKLSSENKTGGYNTDNGCLNPEDLFNAVDILHTLLPESPQAQNSVFLYGQMSLQKAL